MCGGHSIRRALRAVPLVTQQSAPTATVAQTQGQQQVCPSCQTQVRGDFKWCPVCGQALKPMPCAYCDYTLQPEDTSCPACGAPRLRAR